MKTIKSILLAACLAGAGMAFGQSVPGSPADNFQKLTDFLPPAPNAASIIKNGISAVNKNTGVVSVSIPLMNATNGKLSTNIGLSYASAGIKVDEVAGRAGMGWALNAGGVITRTLRGVPDEWNTRLGPPALQSNAGLYNFFNKVVNSADCYGNNCQGYDAEPDIFNFNVDGFSGSFVLDAEKTPICIPASKIKVETFFDINNSSFIITGTNGTKYYFGGANAVEKTKRSNTCGRTFNVFVENAWYLTKIQSPTGEVITFGYTPLTYTYDQGVSESLNWGYPQLDYNISNPGQQGVNISCGPYSCPVGGAPPTACANLVTTQGVLLANINAGNNIIYNFSYRTRADGDDKLVDEIKEVVDAATIRKFKFNYQEVQGDLSYKNNESTVTGLTNITKLNSTPYLTQLDEVSSDLAQTNSHYFSYDGPSTRPPRLSFSQDHWGYFNGRVNTVLVPQPEEPYLKPRFPLATANREVSTGFAGRGLLTKVVYPTGGTETLTYESNERSNINYPAPTYSTPHELACDATGIGTDISPSAIVTKTIYFTIDHAQNPTLQIEGIANGYIELIHNQGQVDITQMNPPVNTTGFSYHNNFNPPYNSGVITLYGPGNSQLQPATYKCVVYAYGSAVTNKVKINYEPVLTTNTAAVNTIVGGMRVKRILSSAGSADIPMVKRYYYGEMANKEVSSLYDAPMPKYYKDTRNTMSCTVQYNGGNPGPLQGYCQGGVLYSNSLNSLFTYGGAMISYGAVIESIGENMEGGATETKYYANSDEPGYVMWGNDMLNATLTNTSSIFNGRLKEENVYKTTAANTQVVQHKKVYNYVIDNMLQATIHGYTINKKYNIVVPVPLATAPTSAVLTDDVTGAFDMVGYNIYSWWTHPASVTETIYDQDGLNPLTSTTNQYFENAAHQQLTKTESTNSKGQTVTSTLKYPAEFSGTAAYDNLIARNILEPVINTKTTVQTTAGTLPVAEAQTDYTVNGFSGYSLPADVKQSVKGNALEIEGTIDLYDGQSNPVQYTNKQGITTAVIYGYNNQYPVAKITGTTYSNATSQLASGVSGLQALDGQALRDAVNVIRTNLPATQVITMTYKKGIGVTSITDANNKTNTYEYDAFNRLAVIRDQDGNVVKKHEYSYANNGNSNNPVIYYSVVVTMPTQASCIASYTGSMVDYTVPYGAYYSLVSQNDADAQAIADANANRQLYANKYGTCSNAATCSASGPQYKFVNCSCETGQLIADGCSSVLADGSWYRLFHYLWSDGSTSGAISQLQAPCVGEGYKKVGCNCEFGTRVCVSNVNNGGGSYTNTYYYTWSDGSNSQSTPNTQTVTCSGPDKKIINCVCETGIKIYLSSTHCPRVGATPPCINNYWACVYKYHWSDGSESGTYTEYNATDCMAAGGPEL